MQTPASIYASREAGFTAAADALAGRGTALMTGRVAAFAGAVLCGALRELRPWDGWLWATLLCGAAFVVLVVMHRRTRRAERRQRALATCNRIARLRLSRSWADLPAVPPPPGTLRDHPYADDLDVFGRPALTQLLAPVASPMGRSHIHRWFLSPGESSAVHARQDAVRALTPAIDWRDELVARGMETRSVSPAEIEGFLAWSESPPWLAARPPLVWAARLLPAATAALGIAHVAGAVGSPLWVLPLMAAGALSLRYGTSVHARFQRAFARENLLHAFPALLAAAARVPGNAPRLDALRGVLTPAGQPAARQLGRLTQIMRLSELRYSSMLHFPVQLFTLWDFHVLHALERWQHTAGGQARQWLDACGEIEGCAALAAVAHDHPDWAFPVLDVDADRISATGLGHPMLRDDRCVRNDVEVGPRGSLLLVTGSNMSGKSTLLRALGCNVVLAQAGAPVCAKAMTLPPLSPFTSGRIRDSLTEGVSLFLAELQRMRAVVDAARAATDRTLFYLLDEMLHGTNTAERRIAARTVLEHLLDQRAIGVVTTHDLSLADETTIARSAVLSHFSERITRDGDGVHLSFDHTLRPGLATSTNALALLEIVGLARDGDA